MINIVKTALTHFGRKEVIARHEAGESYSDIQVDALTQRDDTITLLGSLINETITQVSGHGATETGFSVTVHNTSDSKLVLEQLNALVESHGQLFFKRGCRFVKKHRFASYTSYDLTYNTDHS